MAQDYASYRDKPLQRQGRPRAATRTPPPASSHWNWYVAGVLSALFVVFIGYIGIANLGQDSTTEASAQPVVITEENIPTFSFYSELANASVDVGPAPALPATPDITPGTATTTTPATTTASTEAQIAYLLQAGSFQDRQDAENRRAKIILLNMNATIEPGVVSGRTWQRVQVGPFQGRQSAEEARALLSENNIDSIPLIMR
ncbi:MAG TPA: SPOR domain-containing protein [Hyphomicrobiales bacterium]|nr:SPOR domain-containing protein [Hyphomicrobiales bacterium]